VPVYTKLFGAFFAAFCLLWLAADALKEKKKIRVKEWLLLAGSLTFYAYGSVRFLPVLCYVIAVTYLAGLWLGGAGGLTEHAGEAGADEGMSAGQKRRLAVSGLLILLPLALMKYGLYGARAAGLTDRPYLIPLGISFFSLQALTYLVSVAKGKLRARKDPLTVAVFLCFFPVISSGPILRAEEMFPQLEGCGDGTGFDYDRVTEGLRRWGFGLFQKLVLADSIAMYIQGVRMDVGAAYGTANLAASLLYSFQIYLDFAGYSNIAIGCAQILGYRVPENFDHPYLSRTVTEFWRRWHMSLSSFLRDYVYIPLGGSRVDKSAKIYRNLLLTFLVSGIWHGAGLTFIIWGLLHGAALCLERAARTAGKTAHAGKAAHAVGTVRTFLFVTFAWIFFAAKDTAQALSIIASFGKIPGELFGLLPALIASDGAVYARREILMLGADPHPVRTMVLLLCFAACSIVTGKSGGSGFAIVKEKNAAARWALYFLLISAVLFFSASVSVNFIYNQF